MAISASTGSTNSTPTNPYQRTYRSEVERVESRPYRPDAEQSPDFRQKDSKAWTDNAGRRWHTDIGEISAPGTMPPRYPPTLGQFQQAVSDLAAALAGVRSQRGRYAGVGSVAPNTNPPGTYRPATPLPRGPNGEMMPSSQYPHTQLGSEVGRKVGPYTAAREFGPNGQPIRDINFTDHGTPHVPGHVNPHQHRHIPNPTGGTPQRGPAEPFIP